MCNGLIAGDDCTWGWSFQITSSGRCRHGILFYFGHFQSHFFVNFIVQLCEHCVVFSDASWTWNLSYWYSNLLPTNCSTYCRFLLHGLLTKLNSCLSNEWKILSSVTVWHIVLFGRNHFVIHVVANRTVFLYFGCILDLIVGSTF